MELQPCLVSCKHHFFRQVHGPKAPGHNPKMDGANKGKPYEQMDDLGGFPPIFGSTPTWKFHESTWVKKNKTCLSWHDLQCEPRLVTSEKRLFWRQLCQISRGWGGQQLCQIHISSIALSWEYTVYRLHV